MGDDSLSEIDRVQWDTHEYSSVHGLFAYCCMLLTEAPSISANIRHEANKQLHRLLIWETYSHNCHDSLYGKELKG